MYKNFIGHFRYIYTIEFYLFLIHYSVKKDVHFYIVLILLLYLIPYNMI